jgi:hypothetical protein
MSEDSRQRSRRPSQIQVERLESRALLSASSASWPGPFLRIAPSSDYVNQQQHSFVVTLSLAHAPANGTVKVAGVHTPAALEKPVTVDFSASLDSTSGGPTPAASPIFAPFSESVTFPVGATSETVTVPIISTAATPASVTIGLAATTTAAPGPPNVWPTATEGWVELYSSPDATPPTITSVQLVTQGKLASAVVLGFSKPMAPETVENIDDYRILSPPDKINHNSMTFTGWAESTTTQYQSFPIAAANYDPSTSTVTLTLKRPVKASKLYQISSGYPLKGHTLTDVEGQPIGEGSVGPSVEFTVRVRGTLAGIPTAPGPLKSTFHDTANYFSA